MTSENELLDLTSASKGYRNICYRNVNGSGEIVLYGWDADKKPKTFLIPHKPKVCYECKHETGNKSLFGKHVDYKYFENTFDRRKWVDAASGHIPMIESFRPEQEFLIENFYKYVFDDDFNTLPLRTFYIDIEISIEDEFPKPEDAKFPINIITIYDTYDKKYHSWVIGMDTKNTIGENVLLRKFPDETSMLRDFLKWWSVNYPDVVAGWNIYYFDMPYIVKRLENVLGEQRARMISPINSYIVKQQKKVFDSNYIDIRGITQMDLLLLYRDKFKIQTALDGGYNLDNVALVELDDGKLDYEGSMKNFYKTNFQRFFEYNIKDVELTVRLEEKLGLIDLARRMTSLGLCPYETIYTSIQYIIGALTIFAQKNYKCVFKSFSAEKKDAEAFEGAYVFPTQRGFYRDGIACIDVKSLYPNTMIALNISPETKVGRLAKNLDGSYTLTLVNGDVKIISEDKKREILDTKCIISKNDILFFKHEVKQGILSSWCKTFYDKRKHYQKLMKTIKRKINTLKTELSEITNTNSIEYNAKLDEIAVNENLRGMYGTTQQAIKILLNSAYGVTGTPYSPIFDVDIAQSITLNGQFINKAVAGFLKDKFMEKYNCAFDFNVIVYGDTDSVAGDTKLEVIFDD